MKEIEFRTKPVTMYWSVNGGHAVLLLPAIKSYAELEDIEEVVRWQLSAARRYLDKLVEADWDEAIRQKPMWETQP